MQLFFYFCAILCFVNFLKIRVGGGGVGCGRTTNNELAPALQCYLGNCSDSLDV